MAFVPWKDRVTSTPHRYKLTEVSADTYDLEAVPGSISEAGTPVNAANLDKLIQRDGDDIKDTVVAFTEASTRANIGTGESTATLFGKIKKWFTDLKAHAFNDLATVQGTETDKAPTNKLLKESSFARVYRSLADLNLASTATPEDVGAAMIDNSIAELDITSSNAPNIVPSYVGNQGCAVTFKRKTVNVISVTLQTKSANSTNSYFLTGSLRINDLSNKWSGWKKIKTGSLVSLGGASATNGKYIRFARVSFTGTNKAVNGVFLVYDNNPLNVERHTCVLTLSCMTGSTTNMVKIDGVNIDENILNEFYVSFNPTYSGDANTFDFYFNQITQFSSIVVEFLSSSERNNATQMNPVQNYFDLELEYDSNGNLVTHDTIPSNGVVATFLSKMSTLPVYFPVSPIVPTTPSGPSAAVSKSYADGLSTPYSKVIRTQAEFEALIASPTWLDAVSVALVGQFTATVNITIPATVKQIHGYNGAKITITGNSSAEVEFRYSSLPTSTGYSFCNIEVVVNNSGSGVARGINNLKNLLNVSATASGSGNCYGFVNCANLCNCLGKGNSSSANGYGFGNISYASNCKDGGSSTAMWYGTNTNIDLDTCCKTPVTANNTTLNI